MSKSDKEEVFVVMDHLSSWLARPKLGDSKAPSLWPSCAGATDKDNNFYGSCRRMTFLQYLTSLVSYYSKTDGKFNFWKDLVGEIKEKYISPDKYQMWLFDSADRFEEYIIEHAKESGIYLGDQVIMTIPEYYISGKIDLIVMNPSTGKKIINEVKSVYGYSADEVLGKNFERAYSFQGVPRTRNLMQVAIYEWHFAKTDYENARLIYGDRGTGKYAEYEVAVDKTSGEIKYRCIDPCLSKWTTVTYTIFDILSFYKEIINATEFGIIPKRDFSIKYTDDQLIERINNQYEIIELDKEDEEIARYKDVETFLEAADGKKSRKFCVESLGNAKLSKGSAEKFLKYLDRIKNGGRIVKRPEDGDYQCRMCSFRKFCYDEHNEPRKD